MALTITNIKATSSKAKTHMVREGYKNSYLVSSGGSGIVYRTRLEPIASCTCDWAKYQKSGTPAACSHVQATVEFAANEAGYTAKIRASHEPTSHLHRKTEYVGNGVKATLRKKPASKAAIADLDDFNDVFFG